MVSLEEIRCLTERRLEDPYNVEPLLQLWYAIHEYNKIGAEKLEEPDYDVLSLAPPCEWFEQRAMEADVDKSIEGMARLASICKEYTTLYPTVRAFEFTTRFYSRTGTLYFLDNAHINYWIPDSHRIYDTYRSQQNVESTRESQPMSTMMSFEKQLSYPHAEIDNTFTSYVKWLEEQAREPYAIINSKKIDHYIEMARNQLETTKRKLAYRQEYEDLVRNDPSLENFARYIEWEKNRPKKWLIPTCVTALYERTLEKYSKEEQVWDDYIMWAWNPSEALNCDSVAHKVAARAQRHCPRSSLIHSRALLIKEATDDFSAMWQPEKGWPYREAMTEIVGMAVRRPKLFSEYAGCLALDTTVSSENSSDIDVVAAACQYAIELILDEGPTDGMDFDLEWQIARAYKLRCKDDAKAEAMWRTVSQVHNHKTLFWTTWLEWQRYCQVGDLGSSVGQEGEDTCEQPNPSLETLTKYTNAALGKPIEWPEIVVMQYMRYVRSQRSAVSIMDALKTMRQKLRERSALLEKQKHDKKELRQRVVQPTTAPTNKRKLEIQDEQPSKTAKTAPLDPPSNVERDREHNTVIVAGVAPLKPQVEQLWKQNNLNWLSYHESDSGEYGVVELALHDDFERALKLNRSNNISVYSGADTTLWVTNFSKDTTHDQLAQSFGRYGIVLSVRFPASAKSHKRAERRFAYIQMSTREEALNAINHLHGTDDLVVKLSDPPSKEKPKLKGKANPEHEVYIKGLNWTLSHKDIESQLAQQCGTIVRFKAPAGKDGKKHQGYAFVTFDTKHAVDAALSLNGTEWNGRQLQVRLAQQTEQREDAPRAAATAFVPPALQRKKRLNC